VKWGATASLLNEILMVLEQSKILDHQTDTAGEILLHIWNLDSAAIMLQNSTI
jgi:hypothetical protein